MLHRMIKMFYDGDLVLGDLKLAGHISSVEECHTLDG